MDVIVINRLHIKYYNFIVIKYIFIEKYGKIIFYQR